MPTLTDARFDALRVLVPAAPPTTNDMLMAYLLANGGTGNTLGDRWRSFFISQGGSADLHRNDQIREFLDNEGFAQLHINDAWLAFWLAGGTPGGGGTPLVIAFDQATYDLDYFIGPAPSGIVGVIFENNGNITVTEDGFPAGTVGTWYTGDTPAWVQDDYDFMYDQQNAFSPNQGFDLVNQWIPGLGHGGNMCQWGYEQNAPPPNDDCEAIIRVRDAGAAEIDTCTLFLRISN